MNSRPLEDDQCICSPLPLPERKLGLAPGRADGVGAASDELLASLWRLAGSRNPLSSTSELSTIEGPLGVLEVGQISSLTAVLPDGVHKVEVRAKGNERVRAALEKLGQPIGVNDLHIAGHDRSEGLVLVTNNMSEFKRVPALELEKWVGSVG